MITKKKLRAEMILVRKQLSPQYITQSSQQISEKLVQSSFFIDADVILFYMAIRSEVDLRAAMKSAWQLGKQIALPKVNPKERTMNCYRIDSFSELELGSYGIVEPPSDPTKEIDPGTIPLVIVPGVAFDPLGFRLGYGGGYYDRFFSKYTSCIRVGVAYPEQIVATVYPESHDQPMHLIVTPQQIFNV
ncbi:5-formyltetrahydrofolate cyclo-ligase [Thermoflavimicrobium daqui]|jgi:5-formyltetrahydrofolate cyclo-ligase|uniref:5-formyltetrahydrofolate cyclo-ligase n=1 Tax=Thermoflavimicrobium daqui TaxID=2137476 RepID=A0A364K264_9BACL|nr:5-formyltetrahydrofolate cyclo-ligase [Thermoflavimicrobium daqui]RAL22023.1 5-formyltetrahydrofolate cyclo-ligase [Thermoflavimicrobium daqui]